MKTARTAIAALVALALPLAASANDDLALAYDAEMYEEAGAADYELQAYTDASGAILVKSAVEPAPYAEDPGPAPAAGAEWVQGYWHDRPLSKKWEWVPGYWVTPPPPVVVAPPPKLVVTTRPVVVRPAVRVRIGHRPYRRWR